MKTLRKALRAGVVAVSLATLAACNLAPAYHTPALPLPPAFKPLEGWTQAQPADAAPRGEWWSAFNDPVLDGLEQRLNADNPNLAAAIARYDQARAYADQAKGGLLPSLGAQGAAAVNRQSNDRPLRGSGQPDNYHSDQVNAVAGYELDLWGGLRNTLATRRDQAQASDADRAAIQLSLQAQLASSYFQLRGLDADVELLKKTVAAYQKSYDLTDTLFKGKIAAEMDVSRAEVQLNAALTAQADAQGRRDLLSNAIAVLVGETASTFSLPAADLPSDIPAIPIGIPATLLQRRPDIASAERTIAAANAEVGVSRAALYPSISFDALGGVQSAGTNPFKLGDLFWSLGPNITLPIFEGGRLKARVTESYARYRETAAHYRSTVLTAFQEVEDNRALLLRLGKEAEFSAAGARAAQKTATAATGLYSQGATSYLEVVTAQTALLQSQQTLLDVRTRRFVAAVNLIRAIGGGWEQNAPALSPASPKIG